MNAFMRIAMSVALVLVVALPGGCRSAGIDTARYLPAGGEIAGWRIDGEMLRYGPENLWEYIDGAAEHFLAYMFMELVAQDYRDADGHGLKVEIYQHGSPLTAFGIYSQLRAPGVRYYAIGSEGFGDSYTLHFVKSRYYVKVAVFEESEELREAMERFAEAIAAKILGVSVFPPAVACFPTDGLIEKSETYITEGVLGSDAFPPSFVAEYALGEERGKLYLSSLVDEERAREVFVWYAESIGAEEALRETPHGAVSTAVGNDRYRGETAVFQYGRWIGVLTGFGGHAERREALMLAAVAQIARQTGSSK